MTAVTPESIAEQIHALDALVETKRSELGAHTFNSLKGDEVAKAKVKEINTDLEALAGERAALVEALGHASDREQDERDLAVLEARQKLWDEARKTRDRLISNAKRYESAIADIVWLTKEIKTDNEEVFKLLRGACLTVSLNVIGRTDVLSILANDLSRKDVPWEGRNTVAALTKAWAALDGKDVEGNI